MSLLMRLVIALDDWLLGRIQPLAKAIHRTDPHGDALERNARTISAASAYIGLLSIPATIAVYRHLVALHLNAKDIDSTMFDTTLCCILISILGPSNRLWLPAVYKYIREQKDISTLRLRIVHTTIRQYGFMFLMMNAWFLSDRGVHAFAPNISWMLFLIAGIQLLGLYLLSFVNGMRDHQTAPTQAKGRVHALPSSI